MDILVRNNKFKMQDSGHWIQDAGSRLQDASCRIQGAGHYPESWIMNQLVLFRAIIFCVSLISIFLVNSASAQVYPVNGNAALIPPYSVYLSDYTAGTTDRLVLNIVLNDITRPELRVRLRMKVEGQSVKLETKPEYIGKEIVLQGGIPLRLSGTDLIEYFNPNNLNFSGISRREFEKTGALPQGFYTFCFEVLEYNRGVKISNAICAPGWLILNDPPLVNLPRQNEKLKPSVPQNVILQWTPRHTGSPNSAFSTEYEIKMVEVWPATRNPNDAILTSPPILETTTRATTFIYGPAETPLELGRRYAFRIRAKSIVGVEELDLFKNKGYSEVVSFVYGDACELPGNIQIETAATKFKVSWDGKFNHSGYTFRYRPAGSGNWYESITPINEISVYSLSPSTTYEYQLAGTCGAFDGQYTPLATLKTNDVGEASYSCGLPMETFNLNPNELTGSLNVGDVIQAGDFQVKLTKVSGSNGVFSGEGVIEVSFFNKAKVKAEFTGISVNKEMRMVNGEMKVTGAGVDVVPSGLMNFMDQLSETLNQFDSVLNDIEANLPQPFDPNSFVADTLIIIRGGISSVYKDDNGTIVVTDKQGNVTRLPAGEDYAIKDEEGKGYLVDSKGNIHKTTDEIATKAANREYNLKLKFATDPIARFGFDEKRYDALASRYEQLKDNYFVAWKAVESGITDPLLAKLDDATIDKTKIRFELFGQPAVAPPFTNNQTSVTINGKSDGVIEDLIALYSSGNSNNKEQLLGKLKVITYDKIKKNLVLVPVNNNSFPGTAPQLAQDLNKIFGQAVVEWSVSIANNLNVSLNATFDVGSSGLLSNYTSDMKTVINAYKNSMNDDTYYLFLVSKPSDGQLLGYMPRSKNTGFIFTDTNGSLEKMTYTIAHELGHGAFNLQHTFDEHSALTKSSTDNLMDYAGGTHLFKYQWDHIHHPQIVIGLFESDEAGESKWILIDEKHTRLFNHIYDNHKESNYSYLNKVNILKDTGLESFELDYKGSGDKEWISSWKIRVIDFMTAMGDEFDRIKKTKKGEKISQISIKPKHIYLGNFSYEGKNYPIAMYGNGTVQDMKNAFTKVEVTELDQLQSDENKKLIYADETYTKYAIIALYEENRIDPSVVMQVEKFVFDNSLEKWLKYLNILKKEENSINSSCNSNFCCTKCGKDLTMTMERFSNLFPNVSNNKDKLITSLNIALKEEGFEYNTCERQAKIFAQIAVETNGLKATVEGKGRTWTLDGLLDYFKRTLKARQRWFNQDFWDTKLYKQFSQVGYYEKIEPNEDTINIDRYKVSTEKSYYGYYGDIRQENQLVKIPSFTFDTAGLYKKYPDPTTSEKLEIEKRIFNYAYGNNLGNGDYLSTNDGYNFRGRGGIQVTGRTNYERLKDNLIREPYKLDLDIVNNPDLVAQQPDLIIYSCFIHFKSQLKEIVKLDQLSINQVSSLVNTGNENKTANHEKERSDMYTLFIGGELKCSKNE